jgi:hypothetical protein
VGGSDSHTLAGVGRSFTAVEGATSAREFLAGMRRGQGVAGGESGDYFKLTSAVLAIGGSLVRKKPWMGLCAGLFALAPAVTLANYFREMAFAWYWGQKNRPEDPVGVAPEVNLTEVVL